MGISIIKLSERLGTRLRLGLNCLLLSIIPTYSTLYRKFLKKIYWNYWIFLFSLLTLPHHTYWSAKEFPLVRFSVLNLKNLLASTLRAINFDNWKGSCYFIFKTKTLLYINDIKADQRHKNNLALFRLMDLQNNALYFGLHACIGTIGQWWLCVLSGVGLGHSVW